MDCPTDLMLLNTLFLFPLAYHAIGIYAISLADALCECLKVDRVAVRLDDIFSNGKALNGADKQARPLGNVKFGVACHVYHHCANNKTDIGNQF